MIGWPASDHQLVDLQRRLAREAEEVLAQAPWSLSARPLIGGCFVAFAPGDAGPGHAGDRAWAAAVVWQPEEVTQGGDGPARSVDHHLRGRAGSGQARRAEDVLAQAVVADRVPPPPTCRRQG